MNERKIVIGTYDTASNLWTLNACALGDAPAIESYASVPGRSGRLDLSTVLTDGEPTYDNRTFTARLESSEGTRLEREARISNMINALHGRSFTIVLPDDPEHYITGRVSVTKEYNDLAHAAVNVKATCEPWRYAASETTTRVTASSSEQTVTLTNSGRMSVIPTIKIEGGTVTLSREGWSKVLTEGTYVLPDIYLQTGSIELKYKGNGSATFTYREAVL
jgi:hypothetical protein